MLPRWPQSWRVTAIALSAEMGKCHWIILVFLSILHGIYDADIGLLEEPPRLLMPILEKRLIVGGRVPLFISTVYLCIATRIYVHDLVSYTTARSVCRGQFPAMESRERYIECLGCGTERTKRRYRRLSCSLDMLWRFATRSQPVCQTEGEI
ncbi:hypothetical protein B0H21DRAFT_741136 [Amylocystis lapponica]|nr:hypothetical protein B0H21DRAFT_741136 [Amylocystis lapponica]